MKQFFLVVALAFLSSIPVESRMKQAPNAGYGKRSKINGLPKTKIISPHMKRTHKGYVSVNSYARSK